MDLKAIKARIKDGKIANVDEFERDILLMFTNAMLFNEPTSDIHGMADAVSQLDKAGGRSADGSC